MNQIVGKRSIIQNFKYTNKIFVPSVAFFNASNLSSDSHLFKINLSKSKKYRKCI